MRSKLMDKIGTLDSIQTETLFKHMLSSPWKLAEATP